MWRLDPPVAIACVVAGAALVLGTVALIPVGDPPAEQIGTLTLVRTMAAIVAMGTGLGLVINGVARSTRPPDKHAEPSAAPDRRGM